MDSPAGALIASVAVMLGLLGAAYYLSRRMGNPLSAGRASRYMKSVDRLPVAKDRWIEMVRVGDEVMILGVTGHTIEVLRTIPADELTPLRAGKQEDLFKNMLGKLMKPKA